MSASPYLSALIYLLTSNHLSASDSLFSIYMIAATLSIWQPPSISRYPSICPPTYILYILPLSKFSIVSSVKLYLSVSPYIFVSSSPTAYFNMYEYACYKHMPALIHMLSYNIAPSFYFNSKSASANFNPLANPNPSASLNPSCQVQYTVSLVLTQLCPTKVSLHIYCTWICCIGTEICILSIAITYCKMSIYFTKKYFLT